MTAVAGALGSVIGYVGAEVAESTIFDRLLWPERFYNYASSRTLFLSALVMPMGGPLHKAALETLDAFRENGLYRGAKRGHMLGTAFFHEKKIRYINRTHSDGDGEVRNGFLVQILKMLDQGREERSYQHQRSGSDEAPAKQPSSDRAMQLLFTLTISEKQNTSNSTVTLSEDSVTISTVLGIFCSELSTIVFAVVIGVWQRVFWLTTLLALPLVLKLISLLVSVRRETLESLASRRSGHSSEGKSTQLSDPSEVVEVVEPAPVEIYEVFSPNIGFTLLKGESRLILPFFRHYGHPLRETPADRTREICGIALVYLFVLYFPAGLLALLWMEPNTQYLWLGYQVYTILFMHISRLFGLGDTARVEEKIARLLQDGKEVCLRSGKAKVWASLEIEEVESVTAGRNAVNRIVESHARTTGQDLATPYPSY